MKFKDFDNGKKFMQDIEDMGYPNPFNSREIVIDNKCSLEVSAFENMVIIKTLRAFDPQKGDGTALMNRIVQLADEYKVDLGLDAVPLKTKFQIPKKKLIEFYRRFGFTGNEQMFRKHRS